VEVVRAADDSVSTSSAMLPEPMEVQSMAKSPDPAKTFSEPMQLDFTRNNPMQEHWNAANERLRMVFTDNLLGLVYDVCDRCGF
jgi:hypothetical protein